MATLKITVCDTCGSLDRSTEPYGVTSRDRTVQLDLCSEHAAPLRALIELVPLPGEGRVAALSMLAAEVDEAFREM